MNRLDTALPSSDDLFQNTTSQLLAVFRIRGYAAPVAEELAQKITGEATWLSGVIEVDDMRLDLERHIFWGGDVEYVLPPAVVPTSELGGAR